ncbi:MAG: cell division protein FtsZ [Bacteroidota bacterium]
MIRFDLTKPQQSIIKVIGVGGGGGNAVNHMYNEGIQGVDFIICNTDAQSLNNSPVPNKIQLGATLTEGRGAGSIPEMGKNAALENIDDIKNIIGENTKMLFITAGMGGGTGTGAAPVIASIARELGILTVGIVTVPFGFEGRKRKLQAEEGIKEFRKHVDSLLIICNDKLRELYGDLTLSLAFGKADNILTTAAKGIAEIITVTGYINVDFEDVKTVMKNSGVAIMGSGIASGEGRAMKAVEDALSSPLLNDNNIEGSSNILLYITSGSQEVSMDEVTEITDFIQNRAGMDADIIWGNGTDDSLGDNINITLIATGFETSNNPRPTKTIKQEPVIVGRLWEESKAVEEQITPAESQAPEPLTSEIKLIHELSEEKEAEAEFIPEPEPIFEAITPVSIPEPAAVEVIFNLSDPIAEDIAEINEKEEKEEIEAEEFMQSIMAEEKSEPFLIHRLEVPAENAIPTPPPAKPEPSKLVESPDRVHMDKTSVERISKLKELSLRLKTEEGIVKMEKEPAYIRRQVELVDPKPSNESQVSSFTLGEDSKGGIEIRTNNSFLHDNVD